MRGCLGKRPLSSELAFRLSIVGGGGGGPSQLVFGLAVLLETGIRMIMSLRSNLRAGVSCWPVFPN